MAYEHDRAFSDQFIPEIRKIVGPCLLVPSSLEQDLHEAGDLTILRGRDMMIACRVRRPGYDNFARQFTIRRTRNNGTKTELLKIVEGFGDWFFYGHASADLRSISRWMLIDLTAFRAHLILHPRVFTSGDVSNHDGTDFRWYDVDSFQPDPPLLIAEYVPEEIPW